MRNFFLFAVTLASSFVFCQTQAQLHYSNGEISHQGICGNNLERDHAFEKNPDLKALDDIDQANFELQYQQYLQEFDPHSRAAYTVPVVVHIVHQGGPENISNDQVYDAIARLNEDFSMTNNDLSNTVSAFIGITGNTNVEFKLATKAPNGSCHLGITRTFMTGGGTHDTGDNSSVRSAVQNLHGNWPQNRYMNIFVVKSIGGSAAYTNNPGNWYSPNGMSGSIYMGHTVMGASGTSNMSNRHILSHEVGHWLNLSHCWGSNNNAGQATSCGTDDGVADTPNTIGWLGVCNYSGVTCGSLDNVQNIMDYAGSCRTMFTQGQSARMQTALNSGTAQRNNLWQSSNLALTGTNGQGALCEAKFSSNIQTICTGQSVDFLDESYHNVSGRTWTFNGGSPGTSANLNPTVTYNTPGIYSVTLNVTDGSSNQSKTKVNYILVLSDPGEQLPYFEGFENVSGIPDDDNWMQINENGNAAWQLSTQAGAGGSTTSASLANFGNNDGSKDELISGSIDLGGVDPAASIIFNFEYAYRLRYTTNDEWLRFYISKDCGQTWVLRKNIHGHALSSTVSSGAYTPFSAGDWYSVDITNINSAYYVSGFRYKFQFENDNGNNIYIDNINLYPSFYSSIGKGSENETLEVYPNPATDMTTIQLNGVSGQEYTIAVHSTLGQQIDLIHRGYLASGLNTFEYNTVDLAKGIYLVRIESQGHLQTIKLIIE